MHLRVLAIFAHPDDETFGPGGTLASLAAAGATVDLLCATRGDSGTIDRSATLGRLRLGDLREKELHAACEALGIRPPEVLHLPDGGLRFLEADTLRRPFVRALRARRPHLVLTFHPSGISGHPDHRTVTARVREAFDLAAEEGLWPELGEPHLAARLWGYSVVASKAAQVTYRTIHAIPDEAADAMIDVRGFLDRERAAVAAHASQKRFVEDLESFLGDLDSFWAEEAFMLLAARVPLPAVAPRPVGSLAFGLDPLPPAASPGRLLF